MIDCNLVGEGEERERERRKTRGCACGSFCMGAEEVLIIWEDA